MSRGLFQLPLPPLQMPRPSTPDVLDDDLLEAMAQSSPVRPPPSSGDKRPHDEVDGGSDQDDAPPTVASSGTINRNLAITVQRYAVQKRLRAEQKMELEVFMKVSRYAPLPFCAEPLQKDPSIVREGKLYAQNFHIENMVNKIIVAAPPWVPSDDLNVSIIPVELHFL